MPLSLCFLYVAVINVKWMEQIPFNCFSLIVRSFIFYFIIIHFIYVIWFFYYPAVILHYNDALWCPISRTVNYIIKANWFPYIYQLNSKSIKSVCVIKISCCKCPKMCVLPLLNNVGTKQELLNVYMCDHWQVAC